MNSYRYQDIYSKIKKSIETNHYRAGKLLPTQEQLANEFNVSRVTIKKALNCLEKENLIYTKQGSGTYVKPRLDKFPDNETLPLDYPVGVTYSHRDAKIKNQILKFDARMTSKKEKSALELKDSDPVYDIRRLRFINDKVYSLEHTIIPTKIAPIDTKILKGSLYDYLGKRGLKITDAHRIIQALNATQEEAELLKIKKNTAILSINQVCYDQKARPFELSHSIFIGSQSKFGLDVHLN